MKAGLLGMYVGLVAMSASALACGSPTLGETLRIDSNAPGENPSPEVVDRSSNAPQRIVDARINPLTCFAGEPVALDMCAALVWPTAWAVYSTPPDLCTSAPWKCDPSKPGCVPLFRAASANYYATGCNFTVGIPTGPRGNQIMCCP
jgi:hypothetical protein